MNFDPDRLTAALELVADRWSLPSTYGDTRVHHGYRRVIVVHQGRLHVPDLAWLVEPFAPVAEAWLSSIDPGGFIVEHIDAGPYRERWQVPFTEAGRLFHDDTPVEHTVGVPFRVHHHDWHRVDNDTDAARVVLVVERDVPLDVPSARFQVRG